MSHSPRRAVWIARRARYVRANWSALRKTLLAVLRDHGVSGALSVAVVGDPEMAELHERFLGVRGPTDVLAFPLAPEGAGGPPPSEIVIGEVVVSADTAAREAARRSTSLEKELALYAIHGTLHLVGYDDRTAADRRRMRRGERKYLEVWSRFFQEPQFDGKGKTRYPNKTAGRYRARGAGGAG